MDKRIGNYLLYCIVFCASVLHAQQAVKLVVTDFQDQPLEYAGAGVPFLLMVIVTGQGDIIAQPEIAGLDTFYVSNVGTSASYQLINNVASATQRFNYVVRIDKTGNYTIGPAIVATQNGSISSAPLTLTVREVAKIQDIQQTADAFLHLSIASDTAYVGQQIPIAVRFYAAGDTRITRFFKPEIAGFRVGSFQETDAGIEKVHGIDYRYVEYCANIVPELAGSMLIPAFEAEYQAQSRRRSRAGFLRIFDHGFEYKRTLSNTVRLDVLPLPEYEGTVQAVGTFSHISASVDHTAAQEGEGIIYSLVIEGNADLEAVHHVPLQLPETMRYYESKSVIEPANADHGPRKIFEYIIQAHQIGDLVIPAQLFTYFDVRDAQYRTLYTEPIALSISPLLDHTTQADAPSTPQRKLTEPDDGLLPLNEHGPWLPVQYRLMPFGWFLFLLLLPLLLWIFWWAWRLYGWYYDKNLTHFAYKYAFAKATRALAACRKRDDAAALYDLFVRLIAARSHVAHSSVTRDYTARFIKQKLSVRQYGAWEPFFAQLEECRFYGVCPAALFESAADWLEILEKTI